MSNGKRRSDGAKSFHHYNLENNIFQVKNDHSLITFYQVNSQNPRGPGFWKMNTSFLLKDEYIPHKEKKRKEVGNECENNEEVDAPLL